MHFTLRLKIILLAKISPVWNCLKYFSDNIEALLILMIWCPMSHTFKWDHVLPADTSLNAVSYACFVHNLISLPHFPAAAALHFWTLSLADSDICKWWTGTTCLLCARFFLLTSLHLVVRLGLRIHGNVPDWKSWKYEAPPVVGYNRTRLNANRTSWKMKQCIILASPTVWKQPMIPEWGMKTFNCAHTDKIESMFIFIRVTSNQHILKNDS